MSTDLKQSIDYFFILSEFSRSEDGILFALSKMSASSRKGGSGSRAPHLTAEKSKKVEQFIAVANCSSRQATRLLEGQKWNLERAIEGFFTNPPKAIEPPDRRAERVDPKALDALFDDGKFEKVAARHGAQDLVIGDFGMVALLAAAGIPDSDEQSEQLFAWQCKAKEMGVLTREEFRRGMTALGLSSLEGMPAALVQVRQGLKDGPTFSAFYQFLYDYVKGPERRTLDVDEAVMLWRMWLLNGPDAARPFRHLDHFIEWLEAESPDPITKDLWNQLLIFIHSVDPQLSAYDPNDAWPVRIDEFVEWLKKKRS